MKPEDHSTPAVVAVAPRKCPRGPQVFHRAAAVLRTKHQIGDSVAYAMLVQASVDAGTTVREAAAAIVRASLGTR